MRASPPRRDTCTACPPPTRPPSTPSNYGFADLGLDAYRRDGTENTFQEGRCGDDHDDHGPSLRSRPAAGGSERSRASFRSPSMSTSWSSVAAGGPQASSCAGNRPGPGGFHHPSGTPGADPARVHRRPGESTGGSWAYRAYRAQAGEGARAPGQRQPLAEALRPFIGQWVAVRDEEVLVAANSPAEVVSWLAQHHQQAQSMFRVPAAESEIGGAAPL